MKLNIIFVLFQVSCRHTDVPAVQQGLDQREDLCAASPSGPAGSKVKPLRGWRPEGEGGQHLFFLICNLCSNHVSCFEKFLTSLFFLSHGEEDYFVF